MRNLAWFFTAAFLGIAAGAAFVLASGDAGGGAGTVADADAPAARPPANPKVAALIAEADALLDNWRGRQEPLFAAGLKLFDAAQTLEGDDPALHLALARLHLRMGYAGADRYLPETIDKATAEVDRALALDPGFARAHNIRGFIQLAGGHLPEAEAAFDRAAAHGLDDAALALNRARLLWKRQEKDKAADVYRMVLLRFSEEKRSAAAACAALQAYHAQRLERGDAQYFYVRQTVLDPDNAWAHGDWARHVLLGFHDFDDAIVAARKALAIMDYGAARRDLAMALYAKWAYLLVSQRRKEEAQRHYDEAQRLMPDLDEVLREAKGWGVMDLAVLAISQPDNPLVTGRFSANRR